MRPIDADLMIVNGFKNKTIEVRTEDIIENHEKVVKLLFRDAIDFINKQPTIDAVKVVLCKDCRFHEQEQPGMVYCSATIGGWVEENWFCKGGERGSE